MLDQLDVQSHAEAYPGIQAFSSLDGQVVTAGRCASSTSLLGVLLQRLRRRMRDDDQAGVW